MFSKAEFSNKVCEKCGGKVTIKTEYYCINHDLPIICFKCSLAEKKLFYKTNKKDYFNLERKKYNISNKHLK